MSPQEFLNSQGLTTGPVKASTGDGGAAGTGGFDGGRHTVGVAHTGDGGPAGTGGFGGGTRTVGGAQTGDGGPPGFRRWHTWRTLRRSGSCSAWRRTCHRCPRSEFALAGWRTRTGCCFGWGFAQSAGQFIRAGNDDRSARSGGCT